MVLFTLAYIGPGAGFAVLGSFFVLLLAVALVILAVVSWPFRVLLSLILSRGRKRVRTPVRRVVVLGLDGLDANRCRRLIADGRLPNLARMAEEGTFRDLASTCPPMSPVAWSSFATGVNPGKHSIFDFLNRDLRTYLPVQSSCRIDTTKKGKSSVKLLRRSRPFWKILGEYGVFSAVLRVPITFPPEDFHGLCLSGLCVPDLRGSQGTFTHYTESPSSAREMTGGQDVHLSFVNGIARTWVPGPTQPTRSGEKRELQAQLKLTRGPDHNSLEIQSGKDKQSVAVGTYSEWMHLSFKARGTRAVPGICRFYVTALEPGVQLYASPVNIDPEKPVLPISHPRWYAIYLAKLFGPFATLGLAEDTWARNEGILDDAAFLEQVYEIHEERERLFAETLRRVKKGLCVCVFEASDRIQHMFMRPTPEEENGEIDAMYERMDTLVGKTLKRMGKRDVLMVISDHGFGCFERGVNLNAWLKQEGYLETLDDADDEDYLQGIDWSRTKAYTFGLSGVYLNMTGREKQGVVSADEAAALKQEIIGKLRGLRDEARGAIAVKALYDSAEAYHGPYAGEGPDIVVGFENGYRASWDAAVGRASGDVFTDNEKAWRGDHCVDQSVVPGVLFVNRRISAGGEARLMDVGPTILKAMGVPVPAHMDGQALPVEWDTE